MLGQVKGGNAERCMWVMGHLWKAQPGLGAAVDSGRLTETPVWLSLLSQGQSVHPLLLPTDTAPRWRQRALCSQALSDVALPQSSLLQLPLPAAQAVGFSSPGFQERHLISCARDFVPCHKVIDHQPACRLAALGPHASSGSVHCDWVSLRTKHMPVPAQLWARRAVTAPLAW